MSDVGHRTPQRESLRLDLTTPDEICCICKMLPTIRLTLEGTNDGEPFRVSVCRDCLSEYAPGLLSEVERV